MILNALYEYYQRKREELPSDGLERKEIPYLLVLRPDGGFLHIESTYEGEGRNRRGKTFLVPQAIKKSVNVASNLLWGNLEYVLGEADPKKLDEQRRKGKETAYRSRLKKMHEAFKAEARALPNQAGQAVERALHFLEAGDFAAVRADPLWKDIQSGANLSFKITGTEQPVCSLPEVLESVGVRAEDMAGYGLCLVTGEQDAIRRIHPPIKRVRGAQTSGADIVSFNLPAFTSFGRSQGANAPVGVRAAFAYTTALNHLIASDQCLQIGDATTVFWAVKIHSMESLLGRLFGEPPPDDPDRGAEAIRQLFEAPLAGATAIYNDGTRFYVLGLAAPSKSRLTVRFWHVTTVGELSQHIRQYLDDIALLACDGTVPPLSFNALLTSIGKEVKVDPRQRKANTVTWHGGDFEIPPKLAGDFMHAILNGTLYPQTLLQAALSRVRAEQAKKHDERAPLNVTYRRAALIKAWLNRHTRLTQQNQEREIDMALDASCTNLGYRLGRLFAVLEHVQQDATPGINTTIRDSYFGSASSTPGAVFPTLMRRNQHHMSKLRKEKSGLHTIRDKLIQAILNDGVECAIGFPPILSMPDQGRFVIGYYQQRQALFTKS